ncbi:MAG: exo-alpha-sialidase [Candidatus Sumerlaeota bacterium]|nr:exo-alpha-sialidase [Candidatus Sumerlaeota bacterium]
MLIPFIVPFAAAGAFASETTASFRVQLDVISDGYDGKTCWFHPHAGAIPGPEGAIVLTMQKLALAHSDSFQPVCSQFTRDMGRSWSPIIVHAQTLGRRPLPQESEEGICDFMPKWHVRSGALLGTGHTVRYKKDLLIPNSPRAAVWAVYNPKTDAWTSWTALEMPKEDKFWNTGAGCTQRVDLESGDVLLPIYFKSRQAKAYASTVLRCAFDGQRLTYIEHGSEMTVDIDRGLYEPSLTKFGGRFFLTMRNDRAAYIAVSQDGLHFGKPRPWTFDDGADLGSYNTQAHWVTHSDGLFLVYTRRGANNDNVFRHRAPLFMAQIDPDRLVVRRATERELVPNKGAQLGNFGVVDVSPNETWVTTSEGMQPVEVKKYGSNGRVYAARILWDKPNLEWNRH